MERKVIIAGLEKMQEGISEIIAELKKSEVGSAPATTAKTEKAATPAVKKETPAPAEKTVEGNLDEKQLAGMQYNDLKKLCKQMGVSPVGSKDELVKRLAAMTVEASAEPVEENDEGSAPEENDVQAQVEAATAEMSVEELGELLTSVGITPKGKRQALIALVVKAVEDGLIDMSGDEEAPADEATGGEEATEGDEVVYNDPSAVDITEARAAAMEEMEKEIRAEVKKKKLPISEIEETLESFFVEELGEVYDPNISDAEKVDLYIEVMQRMIDDDGEVQEFQAPYVLNEQNACCGHYLKEADDKLVCELCGTEYDAE